MRPFLPRASWPPRIVPMAMCLPSWLLTRIGAAKRKSCPAPVGILQIAVLRFAGEIEQVNNAPFVDQRLRLNAAIGSLDVE